MKNKKITQIQKRDGSLANFEPEKIKIAIQKALTATATGDERIAAKLSGEVVDKAKTRFAGRMPTVEEVQDIVEEVLIYRNYVSAARAYILYRKQREQSRQIKNKLGVHDDLKLGINAIRVLEKRYLLKDDSGRILETPGQMFQRVASCVASAEKEFKPKADISGLEEDFFQLMKNLEFLPNSPTLMNAGTPLGQLSACFVLPVEDSMIEIFESLKHMALIHQSGGGTGFSFSRLRPMGDVVCSTRGIASGPVSFMKIFNTATEVIKQGGRRRGANMGILRIDHPDIRDFIFSKNNEGFLDNFNISVALTDEFMQAVTQNKLQPLINPRTGTSSGSIQARELFDAIVNQAWRTGDPGIIFPDEINRHNPTPQLGPIEATNPCGELPLLPYESCNLGSINMSKMVTGGQIDWEKLKKVIQLSIRFLDNVIEINRLPLPQVEEATRQNRKIGLGIMGFADALIKMGIPYNSEEAVNTAGALMKFIYNQAYQASTRLASERGAFPGFKGSIYDRSGAPGLRNATLLSIAPTGTISILAGCSSGIEPLFGISYMRNVMQGMQMLEINPLFEQVSRERDFFSQEMMQQIASTGSLRDVEQIPEDVRRIFVTDWEIDFRWHIRMQAAFQKYVDNSVSKTINLPAHTGIDQVKQAYLMAYNEGCKGITIYRYGSKKQQVLYFPRHQYKGEPEAPVYNTVTSEYAGGCPGESCPF